MSTPTLLTAIGLPFPFVSPLTPLYDTKFARCGTSLVAAFPSSAKQDLLLLEVAEKMARGNQRDKAREKNLKEQAQKVSLRCRC